MLFCENIPRSGVDGAREGPPVPKATARAWRPDIMRVLFVGVVLGLGVLANSANDAEAQQRRLDRTLHDKPPATPKISPQRATSVVSPSSSDRLKPESTVQAVGSEESQGFYEEWNTPAASQAVDEVRIGSSQSVRRREAQTKGIYEGVGGTAERPEFHARRYGDLVEQGNRQMCGSPLTLPCFDQSRCLSPPDGSGRSIYVYDDNCTLADSDQLHHRDGHRWGDAVRHTGLLAATYESACLFIHVTIHPHDEPCAPRTPLWNGGANHIMIDFTSWKREHWPHIFNSYAMQGAANMPTRYYRSGFDISMPLHSKKTFPILADVAPLDREFFLTVKGSIYLSGNGLEERISVPPIHDEANGVIVAMKCFFDAHDETLIPRNLEYCQQNQALYDAYDYDRLMNTTFALVPGGRSPGTFRLGEAMSAGAIPVFVVRDWVRPFTEQIDWPSFSFVFAPDDVGPEMIRNLRSTSPETLMKMQRKSLEAYRAIFGGTTDYSKIARNSVAVLLRRIRGHR